MITVQDLHFRYRSNSSLFQGFNLTLPAPGFYSIFGRSGSGKSTLAKLISGRLVVPERALISAPRPTLYVSSEDALPRWATVASQWIDFVPEGSDRILSAFRKVANLPATLDNHLPTELSLGQRQRLNLARYIAQSAPCLILDEALIGVDQPTRWQILEWLKVERRDLVTILVSHEIEDVVLFSKTIAKLSTNVPTHLSLIAGMDLNKADENYEANRYREIRSTLLAP